MADQREFIVRCDHIANNIWDVSHRWVDSGECDEVVRCRDCKRGSDIGTGDLVHCKLLDRMMLRGDYCSMGARKS